MNASEQDPRTSCDVPLEGAVGGLDELLRREARALRERAPAGLARRVLAEVASAGHGGPDLTPLPSPRLFTPRRLAVAAALLVALGLLGLRELAVEPPAAATIAAARPVGERMRSLLDGVSAPLVAMAPEPSPLADEAERLWQDTTQMTRGVLRGLPRSLRTPLLGSPLLGQ